MHYDINLAVDFLIQPKVFENYVWTFENRFTILTLIVSNAIIYEIFRWSIIIIIFD